MWTVDGNDYEQSAALPPSGSEGILVNWTRFLSAEGTNDFTANVNVFGLLVLETGLEMLGSTAC